MEENELYGVAKRYFAISELAYVDPALWEGYKKKLSKYRGRPFSVYFDRDVGSILCYGGMDFTYKLNDDYSFEVITWIVDKRVFDTYIPYDKYVQAIAIGVDRETMWEMLYKFRQEVLNTMADKIAQAILRWEADIPTPYIVFVDDYFVAPKLNIPADINEYREAINRGEFWDFLKREFYDTEELLANDVIGISIELNDNFTYEVCAWMKDLPAFVDYLVKFYVQLKIYGRLKKDITDDDIADFLESQALRVCSAVAKWEQAKHHIGRYANG